MSYGKVHDIYWEDDKIQALTDQAAMLGLFLITGPHRNAIGCFKIGMGAITDNPRFSRWGIKGVSKALAELVAMGFIVRDERTGWTFVANALKHDPIKGTKAAIHAAKLAQAVPVGSEVYKRLKEKLEPQLAAELDGVKETLGWPMRTPIDTPSKGDAIPQPSPDPNPEPSPSPEPQPSPSADADAVQHEVEFEIWFSEYPRQQDRKNALKAFLKARKTTDLRVLMDGLARYKATKPDYQDWAMPASWLNAERWNDVPHVVPKPAPAVSKFGPKPLNLDGEAARWRERAASYLKTGNWMPMWGPAPGESGCGCPPELLKARA